MIRVRWTMGAVLFIAIAGALTTPNAASLLRTLSVCALYVVFLAGLRIVTGLSGLVSLAHFPIIGVGAYATAIVALNLGKFGFEAIVIGLAAGAGVALVIATTSRKLTEDYYAFATVAAGEMLSNIFRGASALTGGPNGLAGIPPFYLFGFPLDVPHRYFLLCVVGGIAAFTTMAWYEGTPTGLAIKAAADEGPRVECLGVRQNSLRLVSFTAGGALAGLGGALVTATDRFVGPESFGIHQSILLLCFLVIGGGLHSKWGVLVAAFFASFGLETLRQLGEWQMIVVAGGALILLTKRDQNQTQGAEYGRP